MSAFVPMWGGNSVRKAKICLRHVPRKNARPSPASGALLAALPAELLALVARDVHSAACVGRMAAVCKSFRAVCESEAVWQVLAFAHFPRLRALLQHMPQPHPPFRLLFRQQQRAERPRRPMQKPTTGRTDYTYTVELRRSSNGNLWGAATHEAFNCSLGALMFYSCGQPATAPHELSGDEDWEPPVVVIWEHAAAPVWADQIVRHYRNTTGDVSISGVGSEESQRVLSRLCASLEMSVFVTRPDGATFLLYNGGADESGIMDDFRVDARGDLFELAFQAAPLPTSGACSAEWRERRKVLVWLRLRGDDREGGVALDGRAEIRYIIDDDDDMDDDNVYGYLESYAPF